MWLNLEEQWTNEVGQLKKVTTLQTAMTKKGRQFFFRKKLGVTPSVAASGDTSRGDVTVTDTSTFRKRLKNVLFDRACN